MIRFSKRWAQVVIFFLILMSSFSVKAYASNSAPQRKFVMVVVSRVGLDDYIKYDLPNIKDLIEKGSIGLLNVRTSKDYDEPSSYLSIGAGSRAESDYRGGLAFNYGELYGINKAGELYHVYTGQHASADDVVNLGINRLKEVSAKQDHEVVPGLLGQILKDNGIPVAVLGNGDIPDSNYRRYVALIGMDESGKAKGDVSGDLHRLDREAPYLVSTDYDKLYREYKNYSAGGGLVVIDLGDTIRADEFASVTTPAMAPRYREQALKKADEFIGKVARTLDFKKDVLLVLTPYPSKENIASNHLVTPIIAAGYGYNGGILSSKSTKREGIVQNIDIAPTVLHFFKISAPESMMGSPLFSLSDPVGGGEAKALTQTKLNYINDINQRIVATYVQRPYFIKTYVIAQIVVLFMAILALFFDYKYARYVKPLILANMAVPLVFLILPAFDVNSAIFKAAITVAVLIAMVFISLTLSRNNMDVIMILCIITAGLLAVDILTGQKLMKNSVLGYDPIIGARFYGIGNEYMGVLMGSSIIGLTALIDRFKKPYTKYIVVALFVFLAYIMSAPSLGTKVGGFIVSFMAYGTCAMLLFNWRFNRKSFIYLFAAMLLAMVGLFAYDMMKGGQSHIGRTALLVKAEGIKPLLMIFQRKLAMNLRLIKYTIWTKVLIAFILVLGFLFYKPTNILINIFKNNKAIYAGFLGSTAGMLFALAFNDAGIIAAATMFIYVVPSFLIMVIDQLKG
ncbi:hypothetical protein [Caldanaerobius polysaccharolyticus]|uniref:hypothetical protein n=1 Tax=Caldanaerobius polysaccharolyticus TaxID=44256 RepID=UPI000554E423|nr:hypothetical protein [Caldanaerobius polysaccharolyticus]